MKKKLSRLLCALLVMTMVLAMVPAVSAAGPDGSSPDQAIVLYRGQKTPTGYSCDESGHTCTAKFYENFGIKETETSTRYVTYDTKTGQFTASAATYKNGTWGYVKAVVTCKGKGCTTAPQEVYMKVYDVAKGVTLKDEGGATISNILRVSKKEQKIYYTLNPSAMNPENIEAEFEDSSVAEVVATGWDRTAKKPYFTVKALNEGATTELTITLDKGLDSEKTQTVRVITGQTGVLTLKDGKDVVSKSTYSSVEIPTLEFAVGNTLTLTPSADSSLGKASDVNWSVDGTANVTIANWDTKTGEATFSIDGTGTATITAELNGETATVKLLVLKKITNLKMEAVSAKDQTLMDDGEIQVGGTLDLKATVMPYTSQNDAKNAKWTITSGSTYVKYDPSSCKVDKDDDTIATGDSVKLIARKAGTFTLKVELGGKTDEISMRVNKKGPEVVIKRISTRDLKATVRVGTKSEIVEQMNQNTLYNSISAVAVDDQGEYFTQVPVNWYDAQISADKKTAKVFGYAVTYREGDPNSYVYQDGCSKDITVTVNLTDEAAVTAIEITSDKDTAIADDRVTLTANATVAPSNATTSYRWYVNGRGIKGETKRTLTYTIPKASSDSSTSYKFQCEVTATYKGESSSTMSKEYTVSVSRDYAVNMKITGGKSSFTVGSKPEVEVTLTYKGSKITNPAVTWKLYDEKDNVIDSEVATISGDGSTATVTTKAVKNAKGDKIVIRATVSANGQSFSSSETITVNPAEAATVKQSVGSGAALKSSSITAAITRAAGSGTKVSYLIFNTPKSCKLTKSSSSSSSLGDTKCYVSTSSGQKLSDVYVKTSASSASVTYTAYDADDYVLATGTVSFDANDSDDTITSSGASFKAMAAVDQITEEYPEAEYVKLDLPRASEGKLYYDFNTISDFASEVKDSDKYYVNASSSQADVEDVYFLPVYGVKGKITIDYTAYGSNNSDLGTGKITLSVKSKTASSKFTDVTASNVGSWAADSIDFCADNDLVNGKSTYSFAPKDNLTRGQLVAILYRAAGSPSVTGTTNPFNDVKTGDYYYNAVLWAYKNDVVNGTGAGKFSPNANVTREQIAAILYRYMGSPAATGSLSGYTDRSKISSWATTAMQWAIGKGYITGTSSTTLDPRGQATRAQAAVMLHRFLTK